MAKQVFSDGSRRYTGGTTRRANFGGRGGYTATSNSETYIPGARRKKSVNPNPAAAPLLQPNTRPVVPDTAPGNNAAPKPGQYAAGMPALKRSEAPPLPTAGNARATGEWESARDAALSPPAPAVPTPLMKPNVTAPQAPANGTPVTTQVNRLGGTVDLSPNQAEFNEWWSRQPGNPANAQQQPQTPLRPAQPNPAAAVPVQAETPMRSYEERAAERGFAVPPPVQPQSLPSTSQYAPDAAGVAGSTAGRVVPRDAAGNVVYTNEDYGGGAEPRMGDGRPTGYQQRQAEGNYPVTFDPGGRPVLDPEHYNRPTPAPQETPRERLPIPNPLDRSQAGRRSYSNEMAPAPTMGNPAAAVNPQASFVDPLTRSRQMAEQRAQNPNQPIMPSDIPMADVHQKYSGTRIDDIAIARAIHENPQWDRMNDAQKMTAMYEAARKQQMMDSLGAPPAWYNGSTASREGTIATQNNGARMDAVTPHQVRPESAFETEQMEARGRGYADRLNQTPEQQAIAEQQRSQSGNEAVPVIVGRDYAQGTGRYSPEAQAAEAAAATAGKPEKKPGAVTNTGTTEPAAPAGTLSRDEQDKHDSSFWNREITKGDTRVAEDSWRQFRTSTVPEEQAKAKESIRQSQDRIVKDLKDKNELYYNTYRVRPMPSKTTKERFAALFGIGAGKEPTDAELNEMAQAMGRAGYDVSGK